MYDKGINKDTTNGKQKQYKSNREKRRVKKR